MKKTKVLAVLLAATMTVGSTLPAMAEETSVSSADAQVYAEEAGEEQVEVQSDEATADDDQTLYTIPTTTVPSDLKDGTYTVPFRLFHADNHTGSTEPYGNPESGYASMGDQTFLGYSFGNTNTAQVTVKNGKVYVTLQWAESIGCYRFNWFESYEDYLTERNSNFAAGTAKGGYPEDGEIISDDSDGILTAANADGASYLYIPNSYNNYGKCTVNAIKEMSFPLPSENPVVWVELNAAGMFSQTQVAYLGFYWDEYQVVSIDENASYNVTVKDTENGTLTVSGTPQKGQTMTITSTPAEGYKLKSVTIETANTEVELTEQSNGSFTFVMPDEDVTISGIFEKKPDSGDTEDPDTPEITDELAIQFYKLKDYVLNMDPDKYYLKDSLWQDSSGAVSAKSVNEQYTELRQWLIDKERILEANQYTVPEADRENFEKQLKQYDANLADPDLFGEVYSATGEESKIVRGHTYEVPVTLYVAEDDSADAVTPLGNSIKTIAKTDTVHGSWTKAGITTAKVVVGYDSDRGTETYTLTMDYSRSYCTEEQNEKQSLAVWNYANKNIASISGTSQTQLVTYAAYKDVYLKYTHQTAAEQKADGSWKKFRTDETTPVVLSIDWDNASDVSDSSVTVDKSVLNAYVVSMNNRIKYNSIGSDLIAAYPKEVTQEIIDSGLWQKAYDLNQDENATQAQVSAMVSEIEREYSKHKTLTQVYNDFPNQAAKKNESDYTKASWNAYKTWVDLSAEVAGGQFGIKYGTPGGDFGATEETAWTKEQREAFGWRDATGKAFSTDPAEGDTVLYTYMSDALLGGSAAAYNNQLLAKYDEMEDALVSVKELREDIASMQKTYGTENDGSYTADSYQALSDAVAAAQATLADEDATEEEVSAARTAMRTAAEGLASLTELKEAITAAEKYESSEDAYTTTTFSAYQKALEAAREVLKNDAATAEEVSNAANALNSAVEALYKRADKTELKKAIDEAGEIVKQTDVYTEASLSIYQDLLNSALEIYNNRPNISQIQVDEMTNSLKNGKDDLVKISTENLNVNKLADGTYTVAVNLWHATQDKESMGNSALYHTATLTVKDGKYTLRVEGHSMTMSGQTGALDAFRLVTNGSEAKGDGSNYTEIEIKQNGDTYYVEIPLQDTADGNKVTDFYYGGIKVHTVSEDGTLGYPMGTNWTPNRLRISWETLSELDVEKYPAFSATDAATGITVTAPEGALPAGTKLEVTKVTDSDSTAKIDNALSSLANKNTPYKVVLYTEDEKGNRTTVEPQNDMELTITLPVTDGYDTSKLTVYFIDADGNANEVKGTLSGTTYSIVTGKVGTYAVSEKKTKAISYNITGKKTNTTTTTSGTTGLTRTATGVTGTKTATRTATAASANAKTGDESQTAMYAFFVLFGASAAMLLAVLRKKKLQ